MAGGSNLRALLVLLAAAAARAGSVVFGVHNEMAVTWSVDATNITMRVTCNPPNASDPSYALAYCAFGINTNPNATSSSMVPAYVWWLGVSTGGAALAVEDRVIASFAQPPCAATQMTRTIEASYDAASGTLSALFTRELSAGGAAGYADIVAAPLQVLAAVGGKGRAAGSCAMSASEHFFDAHNFAIDFLSG
jgi:hypothetical protein